MGFMWFEPHISFCVAGELGFRGACEVCASKLDLFLSFMFVCIGLWVVGLHVWYL